MRCSLGSRPHGRRHRHDRRDGSTYGTEIARFVGAVIAGAGLAKGSRLLAVEESMTMPRVRRRANCLLSQLVTGYGVSAKCANQSQLH